MQSQKLTLSILPRRFAICKLGKDDSIPEWLATRSGLFSITRTTDELSILCEERIIPPDIQAERGLTAFKVEGTLDPSLTGILASLTGVLAEAEISVFVISTYRTDYLLVKSENLDNAISALKKLCTFRNSRGSYAP